MATELWTDPEIIIWKDRVVNGPYKTTGDESTNSPGEYDDWILPNANTLLADPTSQTWTGQVAATSWFDAPFWPANEIRPPAPSAAFVFVTKVDATYKDAVLVALMDQASQIGTDFTDTVRWPQEFFSTPLHNIARHLNGLAHAYDFIRQSISSGDRATLDAWFLGIGRFYEAACIAFVLKRWPNRDSDDYVTEGPDGPVGGSGTLVGKLYFGGPSNTWFNDGWSNVPLSLMNCAVVCSYVIENDFPTIRDAGITVRESAKRYFEEAIKYAVFPHSGESHFNDFNRWTSSFPTLGWRYSIGALDDLIMIADIFARHGDTSLYDYSTSDGALSFSDTTGGPKSLLTTALTLAKYVDKSLLNYGSDVNNTPPYEIGVHDGIATQGADLTRDRILAIGNLYWQNNFIQSMYTRSGAGATPYHTPFSGDRAHHYYHVPSRLLLAGRLEGIVWPYSRSAQHQSHLVGNALLLG